MAPTTMIISSPPRSLSSSSISHFIANPFPPLFTRLSNLQSQSQSQLQSKQHNCLRGGVRAEELQNAEDSFEERLAKLQKRVGRGAGKKAERRKSQKDGFSSAAAKAKSVLLAPVPLQDSVSDGLEVQLGFNAYSERLNGRLAALGLAAVLLVELASGSSFVKYHEPATIGVQVYSILAAAALFVKYEKEKISIWPRS